MVMISKVKVKVAQSCLTLCHPMECTVHGVLEWVAFSFSRGSSQPRDGTQVSCITGGFFTSWATREARILEWVAYPFSSGSSQTRNWTRVSCIAGRFFTNWAMREAMISKNNPKLLNKQTMEKMLDNRAFQQRDRNFKRSRWELKTEKNWKIWYLKWD